ncbi:hypothetical protein BCR44DRAFT_61488 [Catenaria anguillulae PL171]|uniref:ER membrane protein complex subunit 2 n=1 Tax=Catenaria anguillulae PL171 TaxID=765915 RepID=A0A1Y2I093_9FUNG|nr:hypothetical protein BCR44DRAFT_61488 [Catenaria anguillulae PL171]
MSPIAFTDALNELRSIRASNVVQPFRVAELCEIVLKTPSRLGDEIWTIYEQLSIALLDIGDISHAKMCVGKLEKEFSSSSIRVRKLHAMIAEASGDYDRAMALYNQIIEERESDMSVYKRKIGVLKTQGRIKEAIAALNSLLDTIPSDPEGWLELANLYLSQNMLQQAAFAVEEAILLLPTSHFVHLTYAQVQYALGAYELSLKSFCRSVELVPGFVAGLYGIVQATSALLTAGGVEASQAETKLWRELKVAAAAKLSAMYDKVAAASGGKDDSQTVRATRAYLQSA